MADLCTEIQKLGKGIGNAARYRILEALMRGPRTVGELVHVADVTQSAVSQHLKTLKACNLVTDRKEAQEVYYSLNAKYMLDMLQKFTSLIPKKSDKS